MRIGIVGGGPSGIVSAVAIAAAFREHEKRIEIDVYEAGRPFRGRSFDAGSPCMLLNTTVGVTFVDPAVPQGFLQYLHEKEEILLSLGDFVCRDVARRYLETEFTNAGREAADCRLIPNQIDSVSVDPWAHPRLHSSGRVVTYDAIVLATGLGFREPPPPFTSAKTITPYPADRLARIDRDVPVLVLGSRLSAVDALLCLAANNHRGPIHVHSRSGVFPAVRRTVVTPQRRPLLEEFLAISRMGEICRPKSQILVELLGHHIATAGMRLADFIPAEDATAHEQLSHDVRLCEDGRNVWEPMVMDLIDALNQIWPEIGADEKRRFHSETTVWLGRLISSMPLTNALVVRGLFDTGKLQAIGSDALAAAQDRHRVVINATGLREANADPLLAQMANDGLLRFNSSGGVAINAFNHRVREDMPIYANGSILQDEIFTSNSIYSTARGAQRIAHDLVYRSVVPMMSFSPNWRCQKQPA